MGCGWHHNDAHNGTVPTDMNVTLLQGKHSLYIWSDCFEVLAQLALTHISLKLPF